MLIEFEKFFKTLKRKVNKDSLEDFRMHPYANLDAYHFSLGLIIRNYYLTDDSELYQYFCKKGFKDKDDMSDLLIRLFYLYLN